MTPLPDPSEPGPRTAGAPVEGHAIQPLREGWEAAATPPDTCPLPSGLDGLSWLPARVPGTAAAVLRDAGAWRPGEDHDFDAEDWWFRTRFAAAPLAGDEEVVLRLDGIATVAEVHLNGEPLLSSHSMFASHSIDVGARLHEVNELAIRCRALAPLLEASRRPRARWRTRLVANGNLRFFRTMLLGRAPGIAPGPAAVGPWREVRLERRRRVAVEELARRARLDGEDGRLALRVRLRALGGQSIAGVEAELSGPSGTHRARLGLVAEGANGADGDRVAFAGELDVANVARWWPHTHGEPALHDVRLTVTFADGSALTVDAGRVGFRELAGGASTEHDVERDGLDLHVNGVPVFARGAVWSLVDMVGLAPDIKELRSALEQARDAGMNLLRIPGTGAYEQSAFHDLCDELGLLVWQDFMFANLDYPIADPAFHEQVVDEATAVLAGLAGRPSLAVVCGNSEVEQQVAMLGLDPALGREALFGELLPELVRESDADAIYLPSAPCGGELPFRPDRGVANYFGVGGYRRPLEDARRAGVRFAGECLAFSNVPCEETIAALLPSGGGSLALDDPTWKAGVPRDAGSSWDFEDVRDHYLALLFDLDPAALRGADPERYLELSRALTGEVMAAVFGEWRRAASPCRGALVLWLRDLAPGAGWGVVDHLGVPKAVYSHLRRALAPVAVWTTDEGLGGVRVHVANDRPTALSARLRVALYRDLEQRVDGSEQLVELAPHSVRDWDLEALLGRFVDASWAYRFGPPQQDLIVVSLEHAERESPAPISQSVLFPAGRPEVREPLAHLGLRASTSTLADGATRLSVKTRRLAYGVRIHAPGFHADDDSFSVEPGGERVVSLRAQDPMTAFSGATLTALNLDGRLHLPAAGAGAA
jgi:beta-mannosidase